ncbi:MAG: hypothetical protein JNK46_01820 [Methylobacteriaceae bacterium]|nr:hypothetical protein [Methylobacteriaceae bacterium]
MMLRVLGAVPVLGFIGWNLYAGVYLPRQFAPPGREKPVWSEVGLSREQASQAVEAQVAAYRPGLACSCAQRQQARTAHAEIDEEKIAAKVRYKLCLRREMPKSSEKRNIAGIGRVRRDYSARKAGAPFDCDGPNGALAIIRAG